MLPDHDVLFETVAFPSEKRKCVHTSRKCLITLLSGGMDVNPGLDMFVLEREWLHRCDVDVTGCKAALTADIIRSELGTTHELAERENGA